MSDAEHLMENGLFAYRRSIVEARPFVDVLQGNEIIMGQMNACGVNIHAFMDMVGYVYWDVMNIEDRFEYFEDGKLI